MLSSAHRTTAQGAFELPPASTRGRRPPSDGLTISGALSQEMARVEQRQEVAAARPAGRDSVAIAPASGWSIFSGKSSPSAALAAPAEQAVVAEPKFATKADADAAVVKSLQDALAAAGVKFDGLGLAAHEDVVTHPGGSYVNRYISVTANGHAEGLMTDLVAINPKIAVLDIKRMLGIA